MSETDAREAARSWLRETCRRSGDCRGAWSCPECKKSLAAMLSSREATLRSENAALAARVDELQGALRILVNRIDTIMEHPSYVSVFTLATIHGAPYSGPNFENELKAARARLAATCEGDTK